MKVLRTNDDAIKLIRARTPFRSRIRQENYGTFCSLSGHKVGPGDPYDVKQDERMVGTGHLPAEHHDSVRMATFVVNSYDTPIAWFIPVPADLDNPQIVGAWIDGTEAGTWIMPDVKYTTTTTQHQSDVRSALHGYGLWRVTKDYNGPAAKLPIREVASTVAKVDGVGVERNVY